MDVIPPRCPLCPNLIFRDFPTLAGHFQLMHGLRHSGYILAKNMCFSPYAYHEVLQVFKDIHDVNNRLFETRIYLRKLSSEIAEKEGNFKYTTELHAQGKPLF